MGSYSENEGGLQGANGTLGTMVGIGLDFGANAAKTLTPVGQPELTLVSATAAMWSATDAAANADGARDATYEFGKSLVNGAAGAAAAEAATTAAWPTIVGVIALGVAEAPAIPLFVAAGVAAAAAGLTFAATSFAFSQTLEAAERSSEQMAVDFAHVLVDGVTTPPVYGADGADGADD